MRDRAELVEDLAQRVGVGFQIALALARLRARPWRQESPPCKHTVRPHVKLQNAR